jgi:hypothetical protein
MAEVVSFTDLIAGSFIIYPLIMSTIVDILFVIRQAYLENFASV